MVLELHVWGPAFSLPSIDAQCLAAIAYFSLVVPKDRWLLIASSDPSVSPSNELPALRNGNTWVSRFSNIVDYLRQYSDGEWQLDGELSGLKRADNIAFSSFIEARGQPLLDLSLYVSSRNYFANTSPAYAAILQWPNQWIIPPKVRSAAKARTEHLGLSSLDLVAVEEQKERDRSAAVTAGQIPKSLIQRPRDTVSSLLGRTSQQHQFKLDALTTDVFELLETLLADKPYLLAEDRATGLDCLVLGYLSLALFPELPHPWLRDAIRSKAPKLARYTERMRRTCFGPSVTVSDAFKDGKNNIADAVSLPWKAPERVSFTAIGSTLLNTLADATPILKDLRVSKRLREAAESPDSGFSREESKAVTEYALAKKTDLLVSIASVTAGIAALVGYAFHVGLLTVGNPDEEEEEAYEGYEGDGTVEGLSGMQAGDFLGVL